MILSNKRITKMLIRLPECAGWAAPLLFANPEDRFSLVEAHLKVKHIGNYKLMNLMAYGMLNKVT